MPSQFWDLTPVEFTYQVRGFDWRQEREQWRMANIVAAIYNVHRDPKKPRLTAADLLKKEEPAPRRQRAQTPEEQRDALLALVRATGGTVRRG